MTAASEEQLTPRERKVRIGVSRLAWGLFVASLAAGLFIESASWESATVAAASLALMSRRRWERKEFLIEGALLVLSVLVQAIVIVWGLLVAVRSNWGVHWAPEAGPGAELLKVATFFSIVLIVITLCLAWRRVPLV